MKRLLLIGAAAMLSLQTNAQYFDPTFDNDGWRQDTIGPGFQGYNDIAIQTDNKIVVAGQYEIDLFTQDVSVARYNVDGSLDNSFGTNGKVQLITDTEEGIEEAQVAIAPSGAVYIATTRSYGGGLLYICKLNADGTLDNSFGTSGIMKDSILSGTQEGGEWVKEIVIQPDGKILIAGNYTQSQPNQEHAAFIIRYNTDGTRDNSFGTGGIVKVIGDGSIFRKLLLYPDGKILAGGSTGVVPQQDWYIARYNADGTLDNSFAGAGAQQIGMQYKEYVKDMGLQSDGSIIIGGPCGNGNVTFRIIKLTANGMNDANFGTDVTTTTNWGYTEVELQTFTDHGVAGLSVLPDDKIVMAGSGGSFAAVRFNADGDPDNTFGNNSVADSILSGSYGFSMRSSIFNEATGRLYVAGAVTDQNQGITFSNVTAFLVAQPNSVKEVAGTKKLSIYPNPVNGILHMESIEGNIQIQDISGRTMLSVQGKNIDVSELSTGMYFISCITKDGVKYTGQFVKN